MAFLKKENSKKEQSSHRKSHLENKNYEALIPLQPEYLKVLNTLQLAWLLKDALKARNSGVARSKRDRFCSNRDRRKERRRRRRRRERERERVSSSSRSNGIERKTARRTPEGTSRENVSISN
jgi:cellulose biosynthesis protein BcsQ